MSEERSSKRSSRGGGQKTSLFIRNLSYKTRPEDVRKYFQKYVDVKDVYLPSDYRTGDPRGFGFIEFYSYDDAMVALDKSDGVELGGSKINVMLAKEGRKDPGEMRTKDRHHKSRRSRSRSGDRSRRRRSRRSRSRSDSRDHRHSNRRNKRRSSASSSSSKSRSRSSDRAKDSRRKRNNKRSNSGSKSKSPEKKDDASPKAAEKTENNNKASEERDRNRSSSSRSKRSQS